LRKTKYENRAAIIHNEDEEKEVEKKRAKPLLNLALIAGPSPREALIAGPLAAGGVAHNHDTEGRLAVRISTPVAAKGQFYKSRYVDSNRKIKRNDLDSLGCRLKWSSHRRNVAILVMHFRNGLAVSLIYPISKEGGLLLAHGKLITTLPSRWLEEREE
jgi:hypothetical protein